MVGDQYYLLGLPHRITGGRQSPLVFSSRDGPRTPVPLLVVRPCRRDFPDGHERQLEQTGRMHRKARGLV